MLNIPLDSELRNVITIINPLGQDMSIMRTSPLFGMLSAVSNNEKKRAKSAYLFEIGKTYLKKQNGELPFEPKNITIGAYGDYCDFFHIKGVVIETLKVFGIKEATFMADSGNSSFHPYKTAKIFFGDIEIGIIGQIHPIVQENFSISKETYIAILDFTQIINIDMMPIKYKHLNRFPSSEKDFSVVVSDSVTAFDIEKTAKKVAGNLLTSISLFDVYRGNQIPEGKKSVSFSFVLEDYTKTLTDEETNGMLNKIIDGIIKEHNAELR
jgi:phenylalanyl-tRNA synthetase beta chain